MVKQLHIRLVARTALSCCLGLAACSDDTTDDPGGKGTDAGTDAGGGGSGSGGGNSGKVVEPLALGEPLEAPDLEWTWVPFPETRCMNDTPTGLGIRVDPASDKLLIVIQGGGACFNTLSCAAVANANGYDGSALSSNVGSGLLDPDDANNPFREWNMVFIPYCSGDIFTGNALDKTGFGGRTQAGQHNFREYLTRLVPTFADASHVVVSGYSAGGFAATLNWVEAREAWGQDKRVDVLNDSGPPMGPPYLPECMQKRLGMLWNWSESVPRGCTQCDVEAGVVTIPALEWALPYTKKGRHAFVSADEDSVIKQFFSFGQNDCATLDAIGLATFPDGLYPQGLAQLRELFSRNPGSRQFIVHSTSHTWTMAQSPGDVMSEGVVLRDWIDDFLDPSSDWKDVLPP